MTPTNCEAVRDALPDHLRGGSTASTRVAIERHLGACTGCRHERGILELVMRSGALPDERLVERVLQATKPVRRSWGHATTLAAAATFAAALLGVSLLSRQGALPPLRAGEPTAALVEEAVGHGALSWLDNDPLIRTGVGLHDLSVEELEALLMELES
jgi:hypothetical protein